MSSEMLEQRILKHKCRNSMTKSERSYMTAAWKYKNRVDQKRREVQFEVGDEVLAHLRN
jgi:hypothetical protein